MKAVVCLGNPGARYEATRHNIGFRVADRLVGPGGGRWQEAPTYRFASGETRTGLLQVVKPTTYMNSSGWAVRDLLASSATSLSDVLVVVDDIHLALGRLRARRGGSHGGHNGLRSIVDVLGSTGFPRLRLGVGEPEGTGRLIDFVLSEFSPEEGPAVEALVVTASEAVRRWAEEGIDAVMNGYNSPLPDS